MKPLTFGSLFSGIGGLDLGLERAGMECRWQVEINPFARRVLTKHWPGIKKYGDIRVVEQFDPETGRLLERVEAIDLLAGGFPCQDISVAGQGIGIIGARSGLWTEFARLVAELRPRFVFAENVPALRNKGLALVLQDLWALGYDAEWHCVPACSLGAPHERDRIWIVAYPAGVFRQAIIGGEPHRSIQAVPEDAHIASLGWGARRPWRLDTGYSWQREQTLSDADTNSERRSHWRTKEEQLRKASRRQHSRSHASDTDRSGLEVGLCESSDDGAQQPAAERSDPQYADVDCEPLVGAAIARGERSAWTTEPGVVRMVYGVSNRVERLRGLGNAVVPQVAEWIGRRIMEATQ